MTSPHEAGGDVPNRFTIDDIIEDLRDRVQQGRHDGLDLNHAAFLLTVTEHHREWMRRSTLRIMNKRLGLPEHLGLDDETA